MKIGVVGIVDGYLWFDFLFLGMGLDGYCCFFFLYYLFVQVKDKWIVFIIDFLKLFFERIIFIMLVVQVVVNIIFVVNGEGKVEMFVKIFGEELLLGDFLF